ncbi:MATE family efflux transporter [Lachnospira pectinoschiza]|uniref:Probable multidrug resistance protein NorM n=1 Tax=Lachnospira pectinoschiza TaxID=28052 RepID=A0A1G9WHN5_9FIRM|nr:MATE family efflux transporter [Lachnospira pectinoschiza]SDM84000.1 putative efflux protein, MATE family [Lachnospira pectinoschiza]
MKKDYLRALRDGEPLSFNQRVQLILKLSGPAILAQISSIVMQYIDASMVGRLGANDSASIGLVSSSTWVIGGIMISLVEGFSVQMAHSIGAKDNKRARNLMKTGVIIDMLIALLLMALVMSISFYLPGWLGGAEEIRHNATLYLLVYGAFIPVFMINYITCAMIQASGNMKIPSICDTLMFILDMIFNFIFIFPTATYNILGLKLKIYGAGLGVAGAALGTGVSYIVVTAFLIYYMFAKSDILHLRKDEKLKIQLADIKKAFKISLPLACERGITSGASVAVTRIIAPLGSISVAANSFAVTAEALCYMPGYGVQSAATTIIGQSIGAGRKDQTKKLGYIAIGTGVIIMTLTGILMYFLAPIMIGILTPDPAIKALGVTVLRIEAFAEPFFAASIVASGVFRGAGDTLAPSLMCLFSLWCVRVPLSIMLVKPLGLKGVWIAMATELTVRGIIFLVRLIRGKWENKLYARN